jgi:hypothetical protein
LEDPDPEPPVLDYRGSTPRDDRPAFRWVRYINDGEDTFVACAALLFAVLTWATVIIGRAVGAAGLETCLSLPVAGLSTVLSLGCLLERRTSKTFPLVSLGLNVVFGIWIFWFARPR